MKIAVQDLLLAEVLALNKTRYLVNSYISYNLWHLHEQCSIRQNTLASEWAGKSKEFNGNLKYKV